MSLETKISTDFETGTILVHAFERFQSGVIARMEIVVHPPSQDHAEKIKQAAEYAMAIFIGRMIAIGEVPRDGKARLVAGFDQQMLYGTKGE